MRGAAAKVRMVMQSTSSQSGSWAALRRLSVGGAALLCGLALSCGADPPKPSTENEADEASGGEQVDGIGGAMSSVAGGPAGGSVGSGGSGGAGTVASLPAFAITATDYGACGLDMNGVIHCWGATPGEWQVPPGEFVQLRSGESWVCAIRNDLSYECFTEPFGNPGMIESPPQVPASDLALQDGAICVIDEAGKLTCGGPRFGVPDLTPPSGDLFARVSVGNNFACGILKTNGNILCWGNEGEAGPNCRDIPATGQLEPPPGAFVALHSGVFASCAIDSAGNLACWGAGEATDDTQATCNGVQYNHGQAAAAGGQFRSVRVSFNHACGVKLDGSVACWGAGTTDECTLDVNWNCRQSRPPPGAFEQVAVGLTHSCAMTAERKVQCWGNNGAEPGGRTEPPAVFQ